MVTTVSSAARVTDRFSWLITAGSDERKRLHCLTDCQLSISAGMMPLPVTSLLS